MPPVRLSCWPCRPNKVAGACVCDYSLPLMCRLPSPARGWIALGRLGLNPEEIPKGSVRQRRAGARVRWGQTLGVRFARAVCRSLGHCRPDSSIGRIPPQWATAYPDLLGGSSRHIGTHPRPAHLMAQTAGDRWHTVVGPSSGLTHPCGQPLTFPVTAGRWVMVRCH